MLLGLHHLEQAVKGHIIIIAPVVVSLLRSRKIHIAHYGAIATSAQIALHVGEVDVAPIKKTAAIAHTIERGCHARQGAALGRHLHHRHIGKTGIATQGREHTTVGAIAVGIAIGKEHSLPAQTIVVGRDIGRTARGSHRFSAKALEQDDDDVGAPGGEQRHRVGSRVGIHATEQTAAL